MDPLIRTKSQGKSLPPDMKGKTGAKASTPAENSEVWKAHGENLGSYSADDPTYDVAFAQDIDLITIILFHTLRNAFFFLNDCLAYVKNLRFFLHTKFNFIFNLWFGILVV